MDNRNGYQRSVEERKSNSSEIDRLRNKRSDSPVSETDSKYNFD